MNADIKNIEFMGVIKAHRFKVFRKNTKFKKFNRGLIDFVRRKNVKRKRPMNYINLSFISSQWSKNYINQKSVARFLQSVYLHDFSISSLDANTTIKLARKHSFTHGIHTTSIPSKRAASILFNLSEFNINLQKSNFSRNAITSLIRYDKKSDIYVNIGLNSLLDSNSHYYVRKSFDSHTWLIKPEQLSLSLILSLTKSYRAIMIAICLISM